MDTENLIENCEDDLDLFYFIATIIVKIKKL